MMFINSQIWCQEVNTEWSDSVGAEDQARPSVGMFKLRESMNLTQRAHVPAIQFFGGVSNAEKAVA